MRSNNKHHHICRMRSTSLVHLKHDGAPLGQLGVVKADPGAAGPQATRAVARPLIIARLFDGSVGMVE